MPTRLLLVALGLLASLMAACGGDRTDTPARALAAPSSALVAPALCDDEPARASGSLTYRRSGTGCWRSSTLLEPPVRAVGVRRTALAVAAAAATRVITPNELFDWAELTFPVYFPSHATTLRLATYDYRYYPQVQNHLAVSDGVVYVQGPATGGELARVGTLSDFTCLAVPSLCNSTPVDCAPPANWTTTFGQRCVPDAGQTARIAHGARFTFTDSVGPLYGAAPYVCENGTLRALDGISCSTQAPAACNTATLSWTEGDNRCTPNATEPTQVASGSRYTFSDSVGTNGQATFSCFGGVFTAEGTPGCKPRPALNCTPTTIEWSASGNFCSADDKPVDIADGTRYAFVDKANGPVGRAVFHCSGGNLLLEGEPTCAPGTILDSFGDNGGSADGGASGDGSAADGAPIVGGRVRVTDTTGREATATTDTRGYFRVRLTGMVPPLLVRVTRPDGQVRHSVSFQPLRTNGYIFMAVTGLTDKIVSDLSTAINDEGGIGAASMTPARLARMAATVLAEKVTALRNNPVIRAELQAAGLNPDTFDPLNTPFRPDGRGYDRVLDNVVVVTGENGLTEVRSRICTLRELSWTVDGNTCSVAGSTVTIGPGSVLNVQDSSGSTRGSASFTCELGLPKLLGTGSCRLQPQ